MRVVTADFDGCARRASIVRSILGAVLVQERDRRRRGAAAVDAARCPKGSASSTKRAADADEWEALRFAWRVCAHVKSNTVIFTDAPTRRCAVGAGQMSRVDAANAAAAAARGR